MKSVYYNEIDPFAAAWLRELIKAGRIAPGEVDERSIEQVEPADLEGFTQCHFFAGIGVWSYALRAAGWADDTPVWSGSCPCQGFSASGKRGGFSDQRHLWPAWFRLIAECRPHVIFGEQVSSRDGLAWLDVVLSDLEGADYACGALDTCAAGVGAPHIRQRLYFVADTLGGGRQQPQARIGGEAIGARESDEQLGDNVNALHGLADTERDGGRADLTRREAEGREADGRDSQAGGPLDNPADGWSAITFPLLRSSSARPGPTGELGHAAGIGRGEGWPESAREQGRPDAAQPSLTNGFWADAAWLWCRDGKWRPVEPGTFPLAHGAPARVGRLRGYGNAINAQVAQAFIEAYREERGC